MRAMNYSFSTHSCKWRCVPITHTEHVLPLASVEILPHLFLNYPAFPCWGTRGAIQLQLMHISKNKSQHVDLVLMFPCDVAVEHVLISTMSYSGF